MRRQAQWQWWAGAGTVGTLVTTIGIWSQRWKEDWWVLGASWCLVFLCNPCLNIAGWVSWGRTLTASWHQPTLCHLGPATAGWHHSGIYQLSVIIISCQRYFAKFSQYSETSVLGHSACMSIHKVNHKSHTSGCLDTYIIAKILVATHQTRNFVECSSSSNYRAIARQPRVAQSGSKWRASVFRAQRWHSHEAAVMQD